MLFSGSVSVPHVNPAAWGQQEVRDSSRRLLQCLAVTLALGLKRRSHLRQVKAPDQLAQVVRRTALLRPHFGQGGDQFVERRVEKHLTGGAKLPTVR